MGGKKNLGRWALYIGCLAAALGALGYYWLEYIPGQREYFLNLRFRALAVIGDQFRSKVAGLALSIDHATKPGEQAIGEYLAAMVPDLTLACAPARQDASPLVDIDTVRFDAGAGCTATATISKILSRAVNDDLFDDVLIADATGRVLYQRSVSSPRVLNLAQLWTRPADQKPTLVEANGLDADAVRTVQLDGSAYLLLLQPLNLSSLPGPTKPVNLVLAGLARSDRLAAEARHVAPKHLLLIFTPLIVVLLSGPFLKILLLTRTGRLLFRDMVLLALFTVIAAGMTSILLLSWHDYELAVDTTEPSMTDFADSLEAAIVSDLRLMRRTLGDFDQALPRFLTGPADRYRTDIWMTDLRSIGRPFPPLDFVFWTNADGCQAVKWSTKKMTTKLINQTPEEHFQRILAGSLSALDDEPQNRFTLQARISPTTSRMIVVMDAPPLPHEPMAGCGSKEPSPIISVAMVAPIPSLDSPIVPPGAGFAVFDHDGQVIFHSVPERNLHENLFEEMRNPEPWRAAVAMRAERSQPAYYRGRKYDFHVRPFRHLAGTSWSIATFREVEPDQAVIGVVWTETLTWFLTVLAIVMAGFAGAFLVARAAFRVPWRRQRDFILARLWPHPRRKALYNSIAVQLAILSAAATVLLLAASRDPIRGAGWLLPVLLLTPLCAGALIAVRVCRAQPVSWSGPIAPATQPGYIACLALCVLLFAGIPASGLFHICGAFEARLTLMHWQQELANQIDARQARRTGDIQANPAYTDAAKRFLTQPDSGLEGPGGQWARPGYLRDFWNTTVDSVSGSREWQPAWWHQILAFARPETDGEASESGALLRRERQPGPCRWLDASARSVVRCENAAGAPVEIASALTPAGFPSSPAWWLLAAVLMGAAYAWYCLALRRLFLLDIRYYPLPRLQTVDPVAADQHLLVLGLPLSHKDKSVRDWLRYTPPRVNLYEERFHPYWVEDTLTRIQTELRAAVAVRAATVGGGETESRPARPWVHVSNLEAKLREPNDRRVVADLLEKLFTMDAGGGRICVVATSSVDPVFDFDGVLSAQRSLREHEVQRFARILHNFRKVTAEKQETAPPASASAAQSECVSSEALLAVGDEAAGNAAATGNTEDVLPMIAERSQALYRLYWSTCTRSEKLVLIQLAQTGFVNPLCVDTLEVLMRKGLVRREPQPRIMNETFREFLATAESAETVRKWECEGGESSWPVIRNIALVLVAAGLGVLILTQNQAMQTVTAVLTGVGTVIAGVLRLVGFLGGRRAASSEPS